MRLSLLEESGDVIQTSKGFGATHHRTRSRAGSCRRSILVNSRIVIKTDLIRLFDTLVGKDLFSLIMYLVQCRLQSRQARHLVALEFFFDHAIEICKSDPAFVNGSIDRFHRGPSR